MDPELSNAISELKGLSVETECVADEAASDSETIIEAPSILFFF